MKTNIQQQQQSQQQKMDTEKAPFLHNALHNCFLNNKERILKDVWWYRQYDICLWSKNEQQTVNENKISQQQKQSQKNTNFFQSHFKQLGFIILHHWRGFFFSSCNFTLIFSFLSFFFLLSIRYLKTSSVNCKVLNYTHHQSVNTLLCCSHGKRNGNRFFFCSFNNNKKQHEKDFLLYFFM